jgi:predicted DNA binding CopG/RHH family protein
MDAPEINVVGDWEEIPLFEADSEEQAFWEANRLAPALMREALVAGKADSVTITLRMDPRMLARVKRMARSRYLNYQSMIKQWIAERLEKEARDGF